MSHLVENMAYAGETPWHGIGKPVSNKLSTDEMLKACGADWEVEKVPTFVKISGKEIATGEYSIRRKDRDDVSSLLSTVSEDWQDIQNKQGFDFFRDYVKKGKLEMHTAGVLDQGRMVWILAKVKKGFTLAKKDHVEGYMLFSIPHQYGKSITIMNTNIRVVCNNTIQLALSGKSDIVVRLNHRRKFDEDFVKRTLGMNDSLLEKYKEAGEFLITKKAKEKDTAEFFSKIFPLTSNKKGIEGKVSRNANMLLEILETQPGAEFGRGTWWQNFNAVTYAVDHLVGNSQETRLNSAFYGVGRKRKVDALNLALKMAKAS